MGIAAPLPAAPPHRRLLRRRLWPRFLRLTRHDTSPTGARPHDRSLTLQAEYRDFEAFFWQFEHKIYGYLLRLTGDADTARDLCQETFLRAWQHFKEIAAHRDNGRWLFRVASNLAINHHRRRMTVVGTIMPIDTDTVGIADPNEQFSQHEFVLDILRQLPPRQRAVLILHEVYDLKCDEIGELLSITASAVKMALCRAREHFAQIYAREEEVGNG